MKGRKILGVFAAITALTLSARVSAATPGAVKLQEGQIAMVDTALGTIACGYLSNGWQGGKVIRGGAFLAFSEEAKRIKLQMKTASALKKPKLEKALAKAKALLKGSAVECKNLPKPVSTTPPPTPTPNSPKATPTPSANACRDNLDISGKWGIPSGYKGKVSRGEIEWEFSCEGCHGSAFARQNRSYQEMDYAFDSTPEMAAYRPTTQQLVDITVFVNCLAELNNR